MQERTINNQPEGERDIEHYVIKKCWMLGYR